MTTSMGTSTTLELGQDSRRSCQFTKIASTCIEKVKINFHSLQSELEEHREWLMHHNICKGLDKKDCTSYEHFEGDSPFLHNEASIQEENFGYLKLNQIIQGIHNLAERLDSDCIRLSNLLEREKFRTEKLRDDLCKQAYQRYHELCKDIQKEHEKCAVDVQELKWHCDFQGRIELRLKEKIRVAGKCNSKLHQQISFIEVNCPLIKEKLECEKEAKYCIKNEQEITNKKLSSELEKLNIQEAEFNKLMKIFTKEQKISADELSLLSKKLNDMQQVYINHQKEHKEMSSRLSGMKNLIVTLESEISVLDQRIMEIELLNSELEKDMQQTAEHCRRNNIKYAELVEEERLNNQKRLDLQMLIKKELGQLNLQVSNQTNNLRMLVLGNQKLDKEIDDLKAKISQR